MTERAVDPHVPRDRFFIRDADPDFVYRWTNQSDRVMLERLDIGWEVAKFKDSELPAEIAAMGQSIENPAGGTVRRRGDLIAMRIPRKVFEERIRKPKEEARKAQREDALSMVERANDEVRRALRRRGYKDEQIRKLHVYEDTADGEIRTGG